MAWIYLVTFLSWTTFSHAAEHCKIRNIKSFYNLLKENSPNYDQSLREKELFNSEVDVAKQRPNPGLRFEYLKGEELGQNITSFGIESEFVFELGDKRAKRISKASIYRDINKSQVDLKLYETNVESVFIYQRVAQLDVLIRAIQEANETFSKIVNGLSSRKRLSPEETLSLSTLRLASYDYNVQVNELENLKLQLEAKIKFLSNCNNLKAYYHEFNFPNLESHNSETSKNSLLELENSKVSLANEELEIQKSLGYSNILVGPMFEFVGQGEEEFFSVGVAVSFDLPLFQTNDGGKLKALREFEAQKLESSNKRKMLELEKTNLLRGYQRSMALLKNTPSLKSLQNKHEQTENLFSRGVVSIPLAIEAHRQQIDFLKSRFKLENDLLESYLRVSLIDGDLYAFEKLFK